ncbi:DUF1045 domain-containing protein [Roseinatronobacter sp. NSM]|uniref:DUF1045 domain-containing protein n=1 Tax=Roseinatronobacter sp. NSM TaxID=3457785 RepID=UPI004036F30C
MTGDFTRFAVYYAPPPGSELARAGAGWLGWDADAGQAVAHPDLGLDLAQLTATPRKYGLHGTLKAPMRLSCPVASFLDGVETVAQTLAPVELGRLTLRALDGFVAIMPQPPQPPALSDAAARIVQDLDPFRAPLSAQDLARRRATPLSARQETLLQDWGYPYVMDEFRFHITLSGRVSPATMPDVLRAAHAWFGPALDAAHVMTDLAVFAQDMAGRFHLIRRFALRG